MSSENAMMNDPKINAALWELENSVKNLIIMTTALGVIMLVFFIVQALAVIIQIVRRYTKKNNKKEKKSKKSKKNSRKSSQKSKSKSESKSKNKTKTKKLSKYVEFPKLETSKSKESRRAKRSANAQPQNQNNPPTNNGLNHSGEPFVPSDETKQQKSEPNNRGPSAEVIRQFNEQRESIQALPSAKPTSGEAPRNTVDVPLPYPISGSPKAMRDSLMLPVQSNLTPLVLPEAAPPLTGPSTPPGQIIVSPEAPASTAPFASVSAPVSNSTPIVVPAPATASSALAQVAVPSTQPVVDAGVPAPAPVLGPALSPLITAVASTPEASAPKEPSPVQLAPEVKSPQIVIEMPPKT